MSIFFEVHKDLPREGPGDDESTLKAFALMRGLPAQPALLDVACGPGMQTIALARGTGAIITAVDTHQPFLDECARRAEAAGVKDRIDVRNMSMFEMAFDRKFDVIWSEGAIYIIGFERGLREWRELLKPGGYVAVSEISWLRPDPPAEIFNYWTGDYPAMSTVAQNLAIAQNAGYEVIGHFTLPESSWMDNYYLPIEARLAMLRRQYAGNAEALQELDEHQRESDMYRKYSAWYGYEFYILKDAR